MKTQVLTGSKQQIAETMIHIRGEVREAIVFVEEPADPAIAGSNADIFTEMEPHTVSVVEADYSRDRVYTRMDGE